MALRPCSPDAMPGFTATEARDFVYMQSSASSFRRQFSSIANEYEGPLPSGGGLMNEEAKLLVDLGGQEIALFALSYRGDKDAWLRVVVTFCKKKGLVWATISREGVTLSDGRFIPWEGCRAFCE